MIDIRQPIIRPTSKQIEGEIQRIRLRRETIKVIWGAIRTLLILSAAAVLLSTSLLPVLHVRQGSMNPALQDGEIVVFIATDKIEKGDVVAFHYNNRVLIKRVIATEGDWMDLAEDGTVILNDETLYEPYVSELSAGEGAAAYPLQVSNSHYFVMGDHRKTSIDSRSSEIGLVRQDQIIGKAWLKVWPAQKIGIIH